MVERTGWLLYAAADKRLAKEGSETHCLAVSAARHGVRFQILDPRRIEILVSAGSVQFYSGTEALTLPQIVVARMGTATCQRTMVILEHLERAGVICVNSSKAIRDTADKFRTMLCLASAQLPIPRTLLLSEGTDPIRTPPGFPNYPALAKPVDGTHGAGIVLLEDSSSLEDLMFWVERGHSRLMLQEYFESSAGKAVRVLAFRGKVIACYAKVRLGHFKANTSSGALIEPFEDCATLHATTHRAMECLGLDLAGIDFVLHGDQSFICDVNSAPSFLTAQEALGLDLEGQLAASIAALL